MAEDKKSFGSKLGSLLLPGKKDEELSPKDESIIIAIGALMTGLVNIDDPAKLKGQVKSKGTGKPQNTGLLGMIARMTDSLNVITGKKKVNDFAALYGNLEEQQKFIKENVFADSNKDFFKNLGKFGKAFDKVGGNIDKIIELMNKPPAEGESKKLDVDIEGSSDFAKMLDSLKEFNLGDKNEESIDELSKMTQKDGSLGMIFEGIGGLNKSAPNFDEFVGNIKDMDKANSEIVAVGEENNAEKMKAVMQNLGEVAKVILAMCAVGLLLVVVGLISQWLDYKGILMFTGILLLFLAGTMAIFVIAANSLKGNSEVMQGIKSYTFLVIVSAGILIFGSLIMRFINMGDLIKFTASLLLFLLGLVGVYALMNKASKNTMQGIKEFTLLVVASAIVMFLGAMFNNVIPFGDVIGFTLKLGLFLLMITGVMIFWNLVKKAAAEGIKDAIIAVGLAAFILFLGAFSFKVLNVSDLLGFIFYLGVFLFGIVIVMLATSIAMRLAGTGGKGLIGQVILLVVAAAFIMFLGAACFKAINKAALTGFILMFDFFLGSLIAILMPLIVTTGIWEKGSEVIRSIAIFVALAAAVMLIGGGLIMMFPGLLLAIPAFIVLLNAFIFGLVLVLTPMIAVSSIFDDGYKVMQQINKLILIASACICLGGLLIVWFPDLIWGIPIFITMMHLMIGGVMAMMLLLTAKLGIRKAMSAFMILSAITRVIKGVSKAFLLLAVVAAIVDRAGGVVAFGIIVQCVIATIVSILGMMILVQKTIDIVKAEIAIKILNAVSSAVLITSIAFGILGIVYVIVQKAGGIGEFSLLVALVVGSLIILTGAILLLATTLGNGVTTTMAYIAIGVVLAAAAAFAIVAAALLAIAVSLKVLSTIKSFDMTPLIKGVTSLLLLVGALAPLALAMPIILMASAALTSLTTVISKMAEAVKEYADLKISIYEGTKHVGYRHLEKKDFEEAARNVSLIITALTKGIMKAYEEHPEWYGATGLFSLIGNMMNGGQTPLERVIRQSKLLAPLISQIADAVKDYADLKIKTYKGTEHTGYRQLKKKDFNDAATNISLVLTTLTQGVMQVYEEHPEWYGAAFNLQSFFDNFLSDNSKEGTPLERVIKHAMKLGPLVSKIGEAVGDIANLKFANRWDNHGKPIGYKLMKPADFQKASDNVVKTITVLSEGVMKVYEEHPDWYGIGGTSIGSFLKSVVDGMMNDGTPMERVIAQNIKLSTLISKVAAAVKDYAQLTVPIKWNEKGEAIDFRNIKNKDFDNAAQNVSNVLVTLANGVMSVYQEHGEWYENTGIFGSGDTPMEKVIKVDKKLSELISVVAASVKDYAELMIPTEWDKETGKAIKFREMTPDDFINAGNNIGLVVTTAAVSLMGYYPDGSPTPYQPLIEKYMMKDEDDEQEEFERLLDNAQKIGSIISGMADGISKYAKMLVPDQWDPKTGTPIHYVQMDAKMMKDAGDGIGQIITGVANTLVTVYNENKEMFGWDSEEEEFKDDSPIQHVIDSCVNMGKVISGIADGITKFAEMKMPIEWDDSGKPIKFQKIGKEVFTEAGNNIGEILTLLGGTMMGIYEANPEMFTIRMKKEGGFLGIGESEVPAEEMTPFERVTDASVKMATVVGSIAQALQIFADKKVISKDKNGNETIVGITSETINLAKKSITDILVTVAQTFKKLATGPTASLFSSEAMDKIVEAVGKMMDVVGTMSTSLQNLAMLKVPTKWGENGEPTEFRQMNTGDFAQASVNIQLILGALGEAFMSIANDPRNSWITNSNQNKSAISKRLNNSFPANATSSEEAADGIIMVLDGISTLATILGVISGCIYGYATLSFPMGTDDKGQVKYSKPLTYQQLQGSKDNIRMVVCSLAEAMDMVLKDQFIQNMISEQTQEKMNDLTTGINTLVQTMTSVIGAIQQLTESDEAKTLPTIRNALKRMVPVLEKVIEYISQLLSLLISNESSTAISTQSALGGLELNYSFADLIQQYSDKFDDISDAVDKFTDMLTNVIKEIGDLRDPIKNSLSKINELYKIFTKENLNSKVSTIISSIRQLMISFKEISMFDEIFAGEINEEDLVDRTVIGQAFEALTFGHFQLDNRRDLSREQEERAEKEIERLMHKLVIYTDLVEFVVYRLRKMNEAINGLQIANYFVFVSAINGFFMAVTLIKNSLNNTEVDQVMSITVMIEMYSRALNKLISVAARTQILGDVNFETLTNGIININAAIAQVNTKSIAMFMLQTIQLDRFVKTINAIKLINLLNLNRFVDSLNKLANKMGNLDKLTDALSNKLSKVLDKLVERLAHAENTIIKADEIQKRRHELIEKSVQEVSELMKQPMIVEIQQAGGGAPPADTASTPAGTPAPSGGAGGATQQPTGTPSQ